MVNTKSIIWFPCSSNQHNKKPRAAAMEDTRPFNMPIIEDTPPESSLTSPERPFNPLDYVSEEEINHKPFHKPSPLPDPDSPHEDICPEPQKLKLFKLTTTTPSHPFRTTTLFIQLKEDPELSTYPLVVPRSTGPGVVYRVVGHYKECDYKYEAVPWGVPTRDAEVVWEEFLGQVDVEKQHRIHEVCETVEPPGRAYEDGKKLFSGQKTRTDRRRCDEVVEKLRAGYIVM